MTTKNTDSRRCFFCYGILLYLFYTYDILIYVVKRTRAVHPAFVITKERGDAMDMYDFVSLIGCLFSFISLLISVYLLGRDK